MNILITGICGLRNKGVEALLKTVMLGIEKRWPEVCFKVPTYTPDYDLAVLGTLPNLELLHDPYMRTGSWQATRPLRPGLAGKIQRKFIRMLGGQPSSPSRPMDPALLLPYDSPNLVIVSGGDLYCSDYGHENLKHFLEPIHWAFARNVPCILLAQSVGVFKNEKDLELWKQTASRISLITVREPLSKDYLVNETGTDPSKIKVTADTAFLLESNEAAKKRAAGVSQRPLIGVSISQGICDWSNVGKEAHFDAWVRLFKVMLDEWGAEVLIVPHVQETYCDDRLVSTRVWRALDFDPRVRLMGADMTASEYKGMISACQMVVAERMHASLAGLSSGVPTVPVGYSIKARGITKLMVDGTDLPVDSLVIPLEKFVDPQNCLRHISHVWSNREVIARKLQSRVSVMRSLADQNFEVLRPYLETTKESK